MKIILGLIFLLVASLLGYVFSQKYADRFYFYNSFLEFNRKLKTEVLFSHESIVYLINKGDGKDLFYKNLHSVFIENKTSKIDFLNKEETLFLDEYVSNIGKSDSSTQVKYLESIDEKLFEKVTLCEKDLKKYRPLYIKMGLLFGLVILILII